MLWRLSTVVALIVVVGAAIQLRIDSLGSSTLEWPQPVAGGATRHVADLSRERVMPSVTPREGKRAVTVRVDVGAGVAGSVSPGDKVNVMLTRSREGSPDVAVLLQGLRLLAIDPLSNDQAEMPIVSRSVTFEMDTEQAQKLALGTQVGRLSLNLMSSPLDLQDINSQGEDLFPPAIEAPPPAIRQSRKTRVYRGLIGDFPPYYGER